MSHSVQITMIGDVSGDPSQRTVTLLYKDKGIALAKAKVSQDFTNCISHDHDTKPTVFDTEAEANAVAADVVKACNRLHTSLKKSHIMRHFIVRVIDSK